MKISFAVFTDKGSRAINEDNIVVCKKDNKYLFVLCDGLGGHGMGDIASKLVAEVFKNQFETSDCNDDFLFQTFLVAQDILIAEQIDKKVKNKMKTTTVSLMIYNGYANIGYVGDSRLYAFKRNKVKFRTLDHSIPQMLVLSKKMKESEIRNHPERNILLRVMGIDWEEPQCEIRKPVPLKKCQAFLLCSDGFWELIEENIMEDLLKQASSADEWLNTMVTVVQENGKDKNMDNYSATAVWIE